MNCRVYIGIGSNLHQPDRQVTSALRELRALAVDARVDASPLYLTRPVGPAQADFVNAVAAFTTELSAVDLLKRLQAIENAHQRRRDTPRWGPRTLDLDLLLYGDATIISEYLKIPHPAMHQRAFVLQPLFDVAADAVIPGRGKVAELLAVADLSVIKRRLA